MIVTITGLGNVGSTIAFGLIPKLPSHATLNIIEKDASKSGAFEDLLHGYSCRLTIKVLWNDAQAFRDSDFVFHTAGSTNYAVNDRLSVLKESTQIVDDVFGQTTFTNEPYIINIANPVDIISYKIYEACNVPSKNILHTGTMLDSLRLSHFLAKEFSILHENIDVFCIGEHGKDIVPVWSQLSINRKSKSLSESTIKKAESYLQNIPFKIIEQQGSTKFAVARCAIMIFDALNQSRTIYYPIGTMVEDEQMLADLDIDRPISISLPTVVSGNYIKPLPLNLSEHEWQSLRNAARKIYKMSYVF